MLNLIIFDNGKATQIIYNVNQQIIDVVTNQLNEGQTIQVTDKDLPEFVEINDENVSHEN